MTQGETRQGDRNDPSRPAFTAKGRFWRGNLHTHSTRSDGVLSPEEVCRRYKAEGYDFMALTDHFVGAYGYPIVDTVPMRDAGFTTILGAELHSGAMANGELWHILAVGLPADFAPSNSPSFVPVAGQETGAEIAARAVAAGAFVAIAHPQWSGLTWRMRAPSPPPMRLRFTTTAAPWAATARMALRLPIFC